MVTVLIFAGAAAVYFFLAPDFIVYTADGPRLEAGWLGSLLGSNPTPAPSLSPTAQPPVVIVTPVPASASPSVSPAGTDAPSALHALYVPAAALTDEARIDAYIKLFKASGINALVLDMKADSGALSYVSALDAAVRAGASSDSSKKAEQSVIKLKNAGVYLIARMSCYKDNLMPRKQSAAAVKVDSGVIWLDWYKHAWLSPYSPKTTEYLTGVALELEKLGFDELMLDNLTFPVEGKLSYISFGSADTGTDARAAALEGLIESVSDAVSGKMRLSAAVAPAALMGGADPASGQRLAMFSSLDHVYMYLPGKNTRQVFDSAYAGILAAQPESLASRFVPVITAPDDSAAANAGTALRSSIDAFGGSSGLGYLAFSAAGDYPDSGF